MEPKDTNMDAGRQSAKHPGLIEVNDRYRAVLSLIVSLSTALMVLPALFLREFLRIDTQEALLGYLDWRAYIGWLSLASAVASGLVYFYASVKWVKLAWGLPVRFRGNEVKQETVEGWLDWSFRISAGALVGGLAMLMWFFATVSK